MSTDLLRENQFSYHLNSNLVLQAERDSNRAREGGGELRSLRGSAMSMGDRVSTAKAPRAGGKRAAGEAGGARKRGKTGAYEPLSADTSDAFSGVLQFVQRRLGDVPADVLRGAAQEVVLLLKGEVLTDPQRQSECEALLGSRIEAHDFAALVQLGKQITDFGDGGGAGAGAGSSSTLPDEDMGVAVVIDDDEDEEERRLGGHAEFVVSEGDDDDDEDGDGEDATAAGGARIRGAAQADAAGADDDAAAADGRLAAHAVDAHWLQRQLSAFYRDAAEAAKRAAQVLEILRLPDERACETQLVMALDYDKFDVIKMLLQNRATVRWCTELKQAQTDEQRAAVEAAMAEDLEGGGAAVLDELRSTAAESSASWAEARIDAARREARGLGDANGGGDDEDMDEGEPESKSAADISRPTATLDLATMCFSRGARTMTSRSVQLPEGSWRAQKEGYEEVHVPAKRAEPMGARESLVQIADMPEWTQPAFARMKALNRLQSRLYEAALRTPQNLLVCAPTGAGKTNVAVLTMLHELGKHRRADGSFDLDAFKIVYVAPMKALVQEVVLNFGRRLAPYNMVVRELSGDRSLSKAQLAETHVIVTTPEKWDVVTRKAGDRSYTALVKLIIIDEVHLLHDDRGPVLESIVSRTLRQVEATQELVRLVALSATLPNYADVAAFLRVDPEEGLFFFDNSYRPVPLEQQYIGVTESSPLRRHQIQNQICYEKLMDQAGKNQVLIFVHSRKDTVKTAAALRDLCVENDTMQRFVREQSASQEILRSEAETGAKSDALKDLLPFGFGVHHAGLPRADRTLVEDLFAGGHVQVLVSTATLAWGVNLPAHTVIIKGTQVYDPEEGSWIELSPQDIMQMLGRAGRPQYDTSGEGIIVTNHSELQYYLSLMNEQLPIESQFVKRLADNLNAEIVLGTVSTVREAAAWLGYSYLYVRMLREPDTYGLPVDARDDDPALLQHRVNLVHSAALLLDRHSLIRYDRRSGAFQVTPLGRVASHYYVAHQSMATFNEHLRPSMSDLELFRLFSLSHEFRHCSVRAEERGELARLMDRVPVPVKEGLEEPSAKVNVLLQAYISNLSLEGYALMSDMAYVHQSAGRIMRALHEIALTRGWAGVARQSLDLCKMIAHRQWLSQSPLRQFGDLPLAVVSKLEKKDIAWERYYDLKPADLGQLVKLPDMGRPLHRRVHQFPRLELAAQVQPISRSLLRVDLTVTPDFAWDAAVHQSSQLFWIVVEDVDGERVLHHERFLLKQAFAEQDHDVSFFVPLFDPLPPSYFVRAVSDTWLHAETELPVSFRHLVLPAKNPPHTALLDLRPLPVASECPELRYGFSHFNAVQTQTFAALARAQDNAVVCAPGGMGREACAEFAFFELWSRRPDARAVYVVPVPDLARLRCERFAARFGDKRVVLLTGESAVDLKLLEGAHLVVGTPAAWDALTRRWRQRRNVQAVALFVADELHMLGSGADGPAYEFVVARMRYMAAELGSGMRFVGLSACVANGRQLGEWLDARPQATFNFSADVAPVDVVVQGFDIGHFSSRLLAMARPVFGAVSSALSTGTGAARAVVFAPSRRQAQLTAIDLVTFAMADGMPDVFKGAGTGEQDLGGVRDRALRHTLERGVAFVHDGMPEADRRLMLQLYAAGVARVLVATHSMAWALDEVRADVTVVMGTVYYDAHRYVDFPLTTIVRMLSFAPRCVLLCYAPKKATLRRLVLEPMPLESHLDQALHDHMNAEVVAGTVENKEDAVRFLTWSFLYRRLASNCNYYGMEGTSNRHVSEFLSELVETTLGDLEASRCVAIEDEMDVSPLNLGMIAAYYRVAYTTLELFAASLAPSTRVRGLLEVLSNATEFASVPVGHREPRALERLARRAKHALPAGASFAEPPAKTNLLLQAHFGRQGLSPDMAKDQAAVLAEVPRLLQAAVDVISSNGWLKPALAAMELSQMAVQGLWDRDSPLLQVPHVTPAAVEQLEGVFDLLDLEDDERDALLGKLPPAKMAAVARFCNAYPSVEVALDGPTVEEDGSAVRLGVRLEREEDEDEARERAAAGRVLAQASRFPAPKAEGWWVVVGIPADNSLLAIKRVNNLGHAADLNLAFAAPERRGEYKCAVYLMADCYAGVDQELEFTLRV